MLDLGNGAPADDANSDPPHSAPMPLQAVLRLRLTLDWSLS